MSKQLSDEFPTLELGERPQMITVRRITNGIVNHFQIRISEWIMIWPALGMGLAMKSQTDMFSTSASFSTIASVADELTLSVLVLLCAAVRLVALVVNGTFQGFGISPHLRLLASLVSIVFWSQFTLGFLDTALFSGGAWSPVIAYSTLTIIELANGYRSWTDMLRPRRK